MDQIKTLSRNLLLDIIEALADDMAETRPSSDILSPSVQDYSGGTKHQAM